MVPAVLSVSGFSQAESGGKTKASKLMVFHVEIASVAGKQFEVQIKPAGVNSKHRREGEKRIRDCAERDGNHKESFHSELTIEWTDGDTKEVVIKSKYPKGLSAVVRCIVDDLKANMPPES